MSDCLLWSYTSHQTSLISHTVSHIYARTLHLSTIGIWQRIPVLERHRDMALRLTRIIRHDEGNYTLSTFTHPHTNVLTIPTIKTFAATSINPPSQPILTTHTRQPTPTQPTPVNHPSQFRHPSTYSTHPKGWQIYPSCPHHIQRHQKHPWSSVITPYDPTSSVIPFTKWSRGRLEW